MSLFFLSTKPIWKIKNQIQSYKKEKEKKTRGERAELSGRKRNLYSNNWENIRNEKQMQISVKGMELVICETVFAKKPIQLKKRLETKTQLKLEMKKTKTKQMQNKRKS